MRYNETTGVLNYNPYANYHGEDTFTYQAFDGELTSNTVTVTLHVDTREGLTNSEIAGAVIGTILGTALIVLIIVYFLVFRRNRISPQ